MTGCGCVKSKKPDAGMRMCISGDVRDAPVPLMKLFLVKCVKMPH